MKKNFLIFLLTSITICIGFINITLVSKNNTMTFNSILTLDALANNETTDSEWGGITCPAEKCEAGGCGSLSCSITSSYPFGFGSTLSVTAQDGNFACCFKDFWGNIHANSYQNGCCNGPIYY